MIFKMEIHFLKEEADVEVFNNRPQQGSTDHQSVK